MAGIIHGAARAVKRGLGEQYETMMIDDAISPAQYRWDQGTSSSIRSNASNLFSSSVDTRMQR
jgi:hypothetical protein